MSEINKNLNFPSMESVGALTPTDILDMQGFSDIDSLSGKKLADIGTGISDFVMFLQEKAGLCDLYAVDPIFESDATYNAATENTILSLKRKMDQLLTPELCDLFQESLERRIRLTEIMSLSQQRGVATCLHDVENLPVDTFDYITSTNTYFSVQYPGSFLSRLAESLNKNGKIIITDYVMPGEAGFNMFHLFVASQQSELAGKIKKLRDKKIHGGEYISFEISPEIVPKLFQQDFFTAVSKRFQEMYSNTEGE